MRGNLLDAGRPVSGRELKTMLRTYDGIRVGLARFYAKMAEMEAEGLVVRYSTSNGTYYEVKR